MAVKKSELYSSLWASCDALRGGMDAVLHNKVATIKAGKGCIHITR